MNEKSEKGSQRRYAQFTSSEARAMEKLSTRLSVAMLAIFLTLLAILFILAGWQTAFFFGRFTFYVVFIEYIAMAAQSTLVQKDIDSGNFDKAADRSKRYKRFGIVLFCVLAVIMITVSVLILYWKTDII